MTKNQKSMEERFDERFVFTLVPLKGKSQAGWNGNTASPESVKSFIRQELIRVLESLRMKKRGMIKVSKGHHSFDGLQKKLYEGKERDGYNRAVKELNQKIYQLKKGGK